MTLQRCIEISSKPNDTVYEVDCVYQNIEGRCYIKFIIADHGEVLFWIKDNVVIPASESRPEVQ
jgi:hypothetical protein